MWCRCHFAPSVQAQLPYWMRSCLCGHRFHLECTVAIHSWQLPTMDLPEMLLIYSGFIFRVLATVLKPQNCVSNGEALDNGERQMQLNQQMVSSHNRRHGSVSYRRSMSRGFNSNHVWANWVFHQDDFFSREGILQNFSKDQLKGLGLFTPQFPLKFLIYPLAWFDLKENGVQRGKKILLPWWCQNWNIQFP